MFGTKGKVYELLMEAQRNIGEVREFVLSNNRKDLAEKLNRSSVNIALVLKVESKVKAIIDKEL